jgi:hypothetical protein
VPHLHGKRGQNGLRMDEASITQVVEAIILRAVTYQNENEFGA